MKKIIIATAIALSFCAGVAVAKEVKDWHDLEATHKHVQEAMHELDKARAANHYDMDGHAAKAEELLHQAEKELHESIESAKKAK